MIGISALCAHHVREPLLRFCAGASITQLVRSAVRTEVSADDHEKPRVQMLVKTLQELEAFCANALDLLWHHPGFVQSVAGGERGWSFFEEDVVVVSHA